MRCGSWCVVVALLSVVALYADGSSSSVVVDVQSLLKTELIAGGDVLFADFGRDAFGWAEMNLPTGEYIVRLGEKLDEKGRIDMRPGGTIRAAEVKFKSGGAGFSRVLLLADARNTKGVNSKTHAIAIPAQYVESGSRPLECPDFTRGAWKTAKGFTIDEIDLSKLPGGFGDVKRDKSVDDAAKQEGFVS